MPYWGSLYEKSVSNRKSWPAVSEDALWSALQPAPAEVGEPYES